MSGVALCVESTAVAYADRAAVLDGDCLHDYATLWEAVGLLAADLAAAGVRPGQRAAIYIGSGYESLLVMLAVEHLGAVAVPLDIFEPVEHAVRTVLDTRVDHLIGHIGDGHLVDELADDPATSGATAVTVADDYTLIRLWRPRQASSTGPGGFAFCLSGATAALTVGSAGLAAAAGELRAELAITAEDVVAVTAPLTTRATVVAVLAAVQAGACLSLRRYPGSDPAQVAEQLGDDEASVLVCTAAGLAELRAAGSHALQTVRILVLPSAGDPAAPAMPPAVLPEPPRSRTRLGANVFRGSRPARSARRSQVCSCRHQD
ncbi:AMP-binding protein [Nocardia mangyaensis]|uniref:AMP-binding protein n=1 Tax=Nocardia mangyaensis TaxID=2213200 RepID=UPI00267540DA|nr:AMP-binding protein [Nocardia mangyaensis]MDO3645523.1 AMP-binding protein [Nocardia mangyaensis]